MTRRTRSILVDNTLGKVFTNTDSSATVNSSNLIAGSVLKNVGTSARFTSKAIITNNLGTGNGLLFANTSLIVQVVLSLSGNKAKGGTGITLVLKKGSSYLSSSIIGTYVLPPDTASQTFNITGINVNAGDRIYADVTTVGTLQPGFGFGFQLGYYSS